MRTMTSVHLLALALASTLAASCRDSGPARASDSSTQGDEMTIHVSSSAFGQEQRIPERYTADGEDVSPPLSWSGAPQETVEFALICDDPDAPRAEPWVHWVIYGMPGDVLELPEAVPAEETLDVPPGARQGTNDFGRIGYGGPAPPRGHGTHHYYFSIYALDTQLQLGGGATKRELLEAMQGHILARGSLLGTYSRE